MQRRRDIAWTCLNNDDVVAFFGSLFEDRIAGEFDSIIPLASELARTGRVSADAKTLLSKIGGMLLIEHRMVGRPEIGDKPEILWEHAALGGLYEMLEDEFELQERKAALERKLQLISGTAQPWPKLRRPNTFTASNGMS